MERLKSDGISTVILGGCDTHGVMRGKRIPIDGLAAVLEHGLPICDVFWVMHVDESDLVARPDDYTGYFPTEAAGLPGHSRRARSRQRADRAVAPEHRTLHLRLGLARRPRCGADLTARRTRAASSAALATWATNR